MSLDARHRLGRSGLQVSRLALGTMTFGQPGWGCDTETAEQIVDTYLEAGGNLIDTADVYGDGAAEEMLGRFLATRGARDRTVLATKFSLGRLAGEATSAGNGRSAMHRSLEASLRRLRTDHVDLFLMHAWDGCTRVEETMRALDELVRSGKVRYVALSNVTAWYAARAQTVAEWRDYEPLCAVQLEYSLAERGAEHEFPDLCRELGMGLMAWGPLADGLLTGKYPTGAATADLPDGRIRANAAGTPRSLSKRTDRNAAIVAELAKVAAEVGRTPAQVAINWVANRPAVNTVLLGARRPEQLRETAEALAFELPPELRSRLDAVSAPPRTMPYALLPRLQRHMNGRFADKPAGF